MTPSSNSCISHYKQDFSVSLLKIEVFILYKVVRTKGHLTCVQTAADKFSISQTFLQTQWYQAV